MQSVTNDNFGPLVAYLVPGATALAGISPFLPTLQTWFAPSTVMTTTIGGFLYLTVASIAAGMVVSAVRWAIVDTLHSWTGLCPPSLDFSRLGENVAAFQFLIEIHYRHYQFYSNAAVAIAVAYVGRRFSSGELWQLDGTTLAFVILEGIFLAASRDTLKKYYSRSQQLLHVEQQAKQPTPRVAQRVKPLAHHH